MNALQKVAANVKKRIMFEDQAKNAVNDCLNDNSQHKLSNASDKTEDSGQFSTSSSCPGSKKRQEFTKTLDFRYQERILMDEIVGDSNLG